MNDDYGVNTDDLRAMARRARSAVTEMGEKIDAPSAPGHEWIDEAARGFSSAWSAGLRDRVDDTRAFSDRLNTTARVFDEGTDAARAEIDAMIWDQ